MNCSVVLCCASAPRGQQTGTSRHSHAHTRVLSGASAVGVTRFGPDSARTASAQTHTVDPQEALVVPARMRCGSKRTQRLRGGNLSECKDMGPLANVVEGTDPDVQEDPRSVQPGLTLSAVQEGSGRRRTRLRLSNSQARSRARSRPRLPEPARCLAADAQAPSAGPASTSRSGAGGEPRGAQDASGAVNLSGLGSFCCL